MPYDKLTNILIKFQEFIKNNQELIEEHERLIPILRGGSKKKRHREASTQEKELKELKAKYAESKEPSIEDKIKDIKSKNTEPKEKSFKEQVTEKKRQYGVQKSDYGPKKIGEEKVSIYNPTDNIKRKAGRTGEVVEGAGKNKAVHRYTSATMGTAQQQATASAKKYAKLNAKQPVMSLKDMSPEKQEELKRLYETRENKKASEDDLDTKIKAKMRSEMERRGITGKQIADHYRDVDESIPAKQRSNIKCALQTQDKPKLKVIKTEDLIADLKKTGRQPTADETVAILEWQREQLQKQEQESERARAKARYQELLDLE